jgi:hypothetical protein
MVSKINKTTKSAVKKTFNKKPASAANSNKPKSGTFRLAAPSSPGTFAPSPQPQSGPGSDMNITNAEQNKIQDMLMHAQLEFSKIKTQVVREKKREIDTLNFVIKEFMGPFILIGYDLNNNPVEMISADSTAEHDAILERLRRVMYKISQNIANSNGNDPYGLTNN